MTYSLDEGIARKVLTTVDAGLVQGLGVQEAGKMCIEAAVCFALGQPHGDQPVCVGAAVRAYKIRINDAYWSSNEARAKGMRRVAIAQLGSDKIDQRKFRDYVTLEGIRRILPIAMRAAASRAIEPHKSAIAAKTEACEKAADLPAARVAAQDAKKVCRAAADAAYAAAASYAAAAAHRKAGGAHYVKMADKLIELLKDA